MYHGHTSSSWVTMSEGISMQTHYNSLNFNRTGWKIIDVSRSREDTEWLSSGEIRIMLLILSMLLIFKHHVPILDKHVKKLALSRKHGEKQSQDSSVAHSALLVWQLLGMTSHSDHIWHQNFISGTSCLHWQWTFALPELIRAFVNFQHEGAVLSFGLFDLIAERGWLEKWEPFCESKTETHSYCL